MFGAVEQNIIEKEIEIEHEEEIVKNLEDIDIKDPITP